MNIFQQDLGNVLSDEDIDEEIDSVSPLPEQMINTNEDLLVLSCVLYRIQNDLIKQPLSRGYCLSADYRTLETMVTDVDRIVANNIKQFYHSRLLHFSLKFGKLSKFKKDLLTYLKNKYKIETGWETPARFIGMCQKLPHFYAYDKAQLEIFDHASYTIKGVDKFVGTKKLTFLKILNPSTLKQKGKLEYWFVDGNNDRVVLPVDKNNPFISLFDARIKKNDILVDSSFLVRTHYAVQYYVSAITWKLQ